MPYFIGVDGGGTKTAFALFNEREELLFLHHGPGSNHENLGGSFEEAAQIIWTGLRELLSSAKLSLDDIAFTLMGLAGIDHPFQHEMMMDLLKSRGLARFEIVNDGFIVVKAGSKTGAAIGYNCGTGTCCNAIDRTGKRVQLGGLGDFSGDVGNGEWIAANTFKIAYDDCVLRLESSKISELIMEAFDAIAEPSDLPKLLALAEDDATGAIPRALIQLFFKAVDMGDPPALRLVERMAERGAQLIAAHLAALDFSDPAEVVLSGSIHTKLQNETYHTLMRQKAEALSGRELRFLLLQEPPVTGCVRWILQDYNNGRIA
ncbi:MAG: hypothetical protein LBB67_03635 [Oscillospiraceae bacterium]|jgi:N-acetylglucosamine kinase-like BadF-type ATPase|nr:hypothetical protein [Oscillospiraceae bacterium]